MFHTCGLVFLLVAGIATSSAVASADRTSGRAKVKQLRAGHAGASFMSGLQFKHTLRVCNAYPFKHPIDVFVGEVKLTSAPMPYKTCDEFTSKSLKAGDKVDFKVGDASAGSFSISDLPSNDAVLVLVLYRHDTLSTGVAFESHVFSNLLNAQVAVLDTYIGAAKATPRIQDVEQNSDPHHVQRSEELSYGSVMAVNPGLYEVLLKGADGKTKARQQLVALNRESYMVMRCGVEAERGASYPMEIMVFPHSDVAELGSAFSPRIFTALLVTILSAAAALF